MEAKGGPVDLVTSLCLPLPSLVIAELLGVPAEHQELFQATARDMFGKNGSKDEYIGHATKLSEVLAPIVAEKRAAGTTDDLIGLSPAASSTGPPPSPDVPTTEPIPALFGLSTGQSKVMG